MMPLPGDQHKTTSRTTNPFDEVTPRISEYTAQEIATLQSRLEKQLGPEYISVRPGAGGQKVPYLAAEKSINLANEVFGFNGWSSQIQNIQIDFVDENPTTGKVSLGLSVIVRVTLKDGTFHEDIGYGNIENCKGKAAAFEKAKKQGTTDAVKRALRNFGNVLGNCLYDKEYLTKVAKVKVAPTKWDADNLHRHADFATIKKEPGLDRASELKRIDSSKSTVNDTANDDDEYGGSEFDYIEFSEAHEMDVIGPEDIVLPAATSTLQPGNGQNQTNMHARPGPAGRNVQMQTAQANQQALTGSNSISGATKDQYNRQNPQQGLQQIHQQRLPAAPQQLQTPGYNQHRTSSAGFQQQHRPGNPQDNMANNQRPQQATGAANNYVNQQNPKLVQPQAPQPGGYQQRSQQQLAAQEHGSTPPQGGSQGNPLPLFVSGRAAEKLQNANPEASAGVPSFNPHVESPSIRKTSGVDHTRSVPVPRQLIGAQNSASPISPAARTNFTNPQQDPNRRVGMPTPNNMANRSSYKPPGPAHAKRAVDNSNGGFGNQRTPLGDAPGRQLNASVGGDGGGDFKRVRLDNA